MDPRQGAGGGGWSWLALQHLSLTLPLALPQPHFLSEELSEAKILLNEEAPLDQGTGPLDELAPTRRWLDRAWVSLLPRASALPSLPTSDQPSCWLEGGRVAREQSPPGTEGPQSRSPVFPHNGPPPSLRPSKLSRPSPRPTCSFPRTCSQKPRPPRPVPHGALGWLLGLSPSCLRAGPPPARPVHGSLHPSQNNS